MYRRSQNFVFPNLPLPSYKRRDVAQLKMREFYVNILEKRRERNEEVRSPVLVFPRPTHPLIDARDRSPRTTCSRRCRTRSTRLASR